MPITREQALTLRHGTVLYHVWQRGSDGRPSRWRVNGAAKTWVRRPDAFRVPIKHGLYAYDYLCFNDPKHPDTDHLLCLTEEDAILAGPMNRQKIALLTRLSDIETEDPA